MALTAPSSTLTGQTIAASYDQVLFLDSASGVTEATLKIVSGTAGKTALSISDEHVLVKGVDTNNAAGFEVQQTDGTAVFTVNTSSPAFTLTGNATITTADNTDTLTLISTDADANVGPNLRLYRNSGSPADSDAIGTIQMEGRNDNSQDVVYNSIESYIVDASDGTEDTEFVIRSMIGGTLVNSLQMTSTETNINQEGIDVNFRVESNNNANMLFVDGGNDKVGIGTSSPKNYLHVSDGSTSNLSLSDGIIITDASNPKLVFEDTGEGTDDKVIMFNYYDEALRIMSSNDDQSSWNDANIAVFHRDGNVGIGTASPTTKLQVKAGSTEEDVILLEDNSGTDIGALRIHGGAFMMKGKSSSAPIQLQTHDGNEDIEVDPDGFIKFETAGSEAMRIDSSRNVGIGTASPDSTSRLTVGSTTSSHANGILINRGTRPTISGSQAAISCVTNGDTGGSGEAMYLQGAEFHFMDDDESTKRMVIDANGKVGIGATTPQDTLDVYSGGDGNSGMRITSTGSGTGSVAYLDLVHADGNYRIQNQADTFGIYDLGATAFRMKIENDGDMITDRIYPSADNSHNLGDSSARWATVYRVTESASSDERVKKNINPLSHGLSFINALSPKEYKWKKSFSDNEKVQFGLIAQEVKEVIDIIGVDFGGYHEEDIVDKKTKESTGEKYYGLEYPQFIAPLIKAVQELSAKVKALENK